MNIDQLVKENKELKLKLESYDPAALQNLTTKVGELETENADLKTKLAAVPAPVEVTDEFKGKFETLSTEFAEYKAGEETRVKAEVEQKLSTAVEESLKVELPKAAAKAGFKMGAVTQPPADQKEEVMNLPTSKAKLAAVIAMGFPAEPKPMH